LERISERGRRVAQSVRGISRGDDLGRGRRLDVRARPSKTNVGENITQYRLDLRPRSVQLATQ